MHKIPGVELGTPSTLVPASFFLLLPHWHIQAAGQCLVLEKESEWWLLAHRRRLLAVAFGDGLWQRSKGAQH